MVIGQTEIPNGEAGGFTLLMADRPVKGRRAVIFFDGICPLCQGIVRFILRRDRCRYFQFIPIQSQFARETLAKHGEGNLNQMALLEDGKLYTASTAGLRIARNLDGLSKALCLLMAVPRPIRDRVYHWVAERRYRWFGGGSRCLVSEWAEQDQRLQCSSISAHSRSRRGKRPPREKTASPGCDKHI